MKHKYIFPLQIFLILEKTNLKIWLNNSLDLNSYFIFFSKKWFVLFIQILKNEIFFCQNTLIEHSITDMWQASNKQNKWLLNFSRFQIFYNIYVYSLKLRLYVFLAVSKKTKKNFFLSIDKYFSNANWLERESSEMYGIFFFNKKDARKLLLDYSKIEYPFLKNFASEGYLEVFYNFFYNQVFITKNEIVEL